MITRYSSLILAAQLTFCLSTLAQDHLEPEEGILNQRERQWDYAKRVRQVLLKDAEFYHLARMVCLPSFEPEWVVTVVQEERKVIGGPYTYYVEYVGSKKKLSPEDFQSPSAVMKSRASLDRETAEALNKTWRRMLRTTRYPREYHGGADGETYHFSRFISMGYPLAGWEQGKIWSPDEKSLCGEFVAIGERLRAYALAKPEDRDKIRSEIRVQVNKLGIELDRRGPTEEADRPGK